MIRRLLARISIKWKLMAVILVMTAVSALAAVLLGTRIEEVMLELYGIKFSIWTVMRKEMARYLALGAGGCIAITILFYNHIMSYIRLINRQLMRAVVKKKLTVGFEDFQSRDVFQELTRNANSIFALFKSFDQMKSARISLEVTSIKLLMNTISEGVLLINREKVVTHVNHQAEDMLRLIPGEIIGETILRHISESHFLESLDKVLQNERKVTDVELKLREDRPLKLTILPIKNKFGELVRALVVLQSDQNDSASDSKKKAVSASSSDA
ncbi:PAS domain-containing protein [bacterium]|jgi:PAS domain-containing protein|nr:PAS domain-containing protein [bacterium]